MWRLGTVSATFCSLFILEQMPECLVLKVLWYWSWEESQKWTWPMQFRSFLFWTSSRIRLFLYSSHKQKKERIPHISDNLSITGNDIFDLKRQVTHKDWCLLICLFILTNTVLLFSYKNSKVCYERSWQFCVHGCRGTNFKTLSWQMVQVRSCLPMFSLSEQNFVREYMKATNISVGIFWCETCFGNWTLECSEWIIHCEPFCFGIIIGPVSNKHCGQL